MDRKVIINDTIKKINKLPDSRIQEVQDFVEFLLGKIDDNLITKGIEQLASDSKSFEYLNEEEDIYSVNDLKEKYR